MATDNTKPDLTTTLSGADVFSDWDSLLQTAPADTGDVLEGLSLAEEGQAYWESLFHEMNFPGMDLMAVVSFPTTEQTPAEQQKALTRLCRDFVRYLSYHYANNLRSAGVTEEGLFYMKRGQIPERFSVHLKYPLDYGGRLDFDNLIFVQNDPFHELIHDYINRQLIGPTGLLHPTQLFVPVPPGKVYVPTDLWTGSGGKNKQDRSAVAGYSEDALRTIAQKTMPGR